MNDLPDDVIQQLSRWAGITEEEARGLTAEDAEEILDIFRDLADKKLTAEESVHRLHATSYWELPSVRPGIEAYVREMKLGELRAAFDQIAAEDLRSGKPMSTAGLRKEEGAYPPARSN